MAGTYQYPHKELTLPEDYLHNRDNLADAPHPTASSSSEALSVQITQGYHGFSSAINQYDQESFAAPLIQQQCSVGSFEPFNQHALHPIPDQSCLHPESQSLMGVQSNPTYLPVQPEATRNNPLGSAQRFSKRLRTLPATGRSTRSTRSSQANGQANGLESYSSPLSSPPSSSLGVPPSMTRPSLWFGVTKTMDGSFKAYIGPKKLETSLKLFPIFSVPSPGLEPAKLEPAKLEPAKLESPKSVVPAISKSRKRKVKEAAPPTEHIQANKPDPIGQPEVWADTRQGICTFSPFFKAFQSGAYTKDGVALGFLVDKEVGQRDKFDNDIIISRVGGGRKQDESGKMTQSKDQDKSSTALAFKRSRHEKQPVLIIAGRGNSICPSKLTHYYSVLDWFQVTDVWCELNSGFKTWMVRLEKIDLLKESWWSPRVAEIAAVPEAFTATESSSQLKTSSQRCKICSLDSKLLYNQGWTCLNASCKEFFRFHGGYDDNKLDYNNEFLKERTTYQGKAPGTLIPPLPTAESMSKLGESGIEAKYKESIVCPLCGCCSRRKEWCQWSCENRSCNFVHRLPPLCLSINEVISDGISQQTSPFLEFCDSSIQTFTPKILEKYDVYDYHMPGESGETIGFVRLYKSNGLINQQKDGPNALFSDMQKDEFSLKRNPARLDGNPLEIVTSHFAANWGAPYKYGVEQVSKPFSETPLVIIKALKRLTWASEQALMDADHLNCANAQDSFVPFNELLTLGYFEGSDIGYHDDGEKELGPTIASISLGCAATMHFRPKAKSSIKGPLKRNNARGTKGDVLKILLEHGDIMVMHGRKIQAFYEHKVTPHGKLRFAMTSRYVRPELMAESERAYALTAGHIPEGMDKYNYDGDIHAVPIVQLKTPEAAMRKTAGLIKAQVQSGEIDKERAKAILAEIMSEI